MSNFTAETASAKIACVGKHKHNSLENAIKEVERSKKHGKTVKGCFIKAYKCPCCDGYHVGKTTRISK